MGSGQITFFDSIVTASHSLAIPSHTRSSSSTDQQSQGMTSRPGVNEAHRQAPLFADRKMTASIVVDRIGARDSFASGPTVRTPSKDDQESVLDRELLTNVVSSAPGV